MVPFVSTWNCNSGEMFNMPAGEIPERSAGGGARDSSWKIESSVGRAGAGGRRRRAGGPAAARLSDRLQRILGGPLARLRAIHHNVEPDVKINRARSRGFSRLGGNRTAGGRAGSRLGGGGGGRRRSRAALNRCRRPPCDGGAAARARPVRGQPRSAGVAGDAEPLATASHQLRLMAC